MEYSFMGIIFKDFDSIVVGIRKMYNLDVSDIKDLMYGEQCLKLLQLEDFFQQMQFAEYVGTHDIYDGDSNV